MMKTAVAVLLPLLAAASAVAEDRMDGAYSLANAYYTRNWSYAYGWTGYGCARGGGLADCTLAGPIVYNGSDVGSYNWSYSYLNQNVSGLELGGLDFGQLTVRFYNNDVKFVGQSPYLAAKAHDVYKCTMAGDTVDFHWTWIDLVLRGEGWNSLFFKGDGPLFLNVAPRDFASFDIAGGTLVLTNTAVDVAESVPLVVRRGTVSASVAGGQLPIGSLTAKEGFGHLEATGPGSVAVTTLTRGAGGVLDVKTADGGKVFAGNVAEGVAVDPGLVSTSGNEIRFLDYSATEGFTPGTGTPAGARVVGTAADSGRTDSTGDISESYVYRPAAASANTLDVNGAINAPVVFASLRASGTRPNLKLSGMSAATSADVAVIGMAIGEINPAAFFPFTADSTLSLLQDARLNLKWGKGSKVDCGLRLAGNGPDGLESVLGVPASWDSGSLPVNGAVELLDDAKVIFKYDTGTDYRSRDSVVYLNGVVSGRGALEVGQGRPMFENAANCFGGLTVGEMAVVGVEKEGRLGRGDIRIKSGGELLFSNLSTPYEVTNHFVGTTGDLTVQNSAVTLAHKVTVDDLRLQSAKTRDATLVLGDDFSAGFAIAEVSDPFADVAPNDARKISIRADAKDVRLTVRGKAGEPSILDCDLADGANGGRLSLVMGGAGCLLTVGGTNNAYTGETRVDAGTLRLGNSLFTADDLSFWLDASDSSTMTVDGDGNITEWRSKVGTVKFSGTISSSAECPKLLAGDASQGADYFNGHPFARFNHRAGGSGGNSAEPRCRMNGNKTVPMRTIVAVARTHVGLTHSQAGFIQFNWQDVSFRINADGVITTLDGGGATYFGGIGKWGFENGVKRENLRTAELLGANMFTLFDQQHFVQGNAYSTTTYALPYLGGTDRVWGGDMAEVLVFRRLLTHDEVMAVENYLAAKWNPQNIPPHENVRPPVHRDHLPRATALTVAAGAFLDLNGGEQTVASLAGSGTITNSSATAATLVVSGTNAFRGTVAGNVKLVVPAGATEILVRGGATLALGGQGGATVAAANPKPPTDGLICWCDASCPDTVQTNGDGLVTAWLCRPDVTCAAAKFTQCNDSVAVGSPRFAPTGWKGAKPALDFYSLKNKMNLKRADGGEYKDVRHGTVFLVTNPYNSSSIYLFNTSGQDQGVNVTCSAASDVFRTTTWLKEGALMSVDGVRVTQSGYSAPGKHHVLALRYGETGFARSSGEAPNLYGPVTLGSYSTNRGALQNVAEVIVYNRLLTDDEVAATERYLMAKWVETDGEWPTPETVAVGPGCGVVAGAGTVDFGTAAVTLARVGEGTYRSSGLITVTDAVDLAVAEGGVLPAVFQTPVAFGDGVRPVHVAVHSFDDVNLGSGYQLAVRTEAGRTGTLDSTDALPRGWRFETRDQDSYFARPGFLLYVQ